MIEPNMYEGLPTWPDWLDAEKNRSTRSEKIYRDGHWTYLDGYVFNLKNKTLRYRKFIHTLEQNDNWSSEEWNEYSQDYDFSINPITCVMEDQL